MLWWAVLVGMVVALTTAMLLVTRYAPAAISQRNPGLDLMTAGPSPKVEVEGDLTHEVGIVRQGSTGRHGWTVKNVGERDLELWRGAATYNCKPSVFKDRAKVVVKPGETIEIVIDWAARRVVGQLRNGLVVATNDPTLAWFPLFVQGEIKPPG